jgi:hypothetical protein
MTGKTQNLEDDLAFMRQLAEGGGPPLQWSKFALSYLAGGLIYGVEMLFHMGQNLGWVNLAPLPGLIATLSFTVAFLVALAIIQWTRRAEGSPGLANRAMVSAFGAAGLTNLAMITVFGVTAGRHHSLTIWLLYPTLVFALQGAAWYVAASLQRRVWMGAISAGWFAAAIALGLSVDARVAYMAICGVALFGLMAAPGALLLRRARTAG